MSLKMLVSNSSQSWRFKMAEDDDLKSGFVLRDVNTKKRIGPYFEYPLQAYKYNKKHYADCQAFEIVKVFSKKLLCEKCGAKLKRVTFIKFKCPNCGWGKTVF